MDKTRKDKSWFYWHHKTLFLHVYLQPRASTDKIVGVHDDCLKIRLTAPPIEGRANKYLIKFLAQCFDVPEARVMISKGELGRKKWVQIDSPKKLEMLNKIKTDE